MSSLSSPLTIDDETRSNGLDGREDREWWHRTQWMTAVMWPSAGDAGR